LPPQRLQQLRQDLHAVGLEMKEGTAMDAKLAEMRGMYEPFVNALADFLLFTLPPIVPEKTTVDNWQTSAWMRRAPGIRALGVLKDGDEHFD
jgi:hypothetical protein